MFALHQPQVIENHRECIYASKEGYRMCLKMGGKFHET